MCMHAYTWFLRNLPNICDLFCFYHVPLQLVIIFVVSPFTAITCYFRDNVTPHIHYILFLLCNVFTTITCHSGYTMRPKMTSVVFVKQCITMTCYSGCVTLLGAIRTNTGS